MAAPKKIHIHMFSIHGLIRGHNLELGRDADTGGQVKYVVELGRQLSLREDVEQVDLFTRLVSDKRVSEDYAAPTEAVGEKFRIVRIQCGGRKYMRKEMLWPHLDEFVDKTIKFIKREGTLPDIVHGHYPDAGYIALHLSRIFGLPFVYTGHSLGRSKLQKLMEDGMREADVVKKYKIDRRIEAEEEILASADLVVTSTQQEIDAQYGLYDNRNVPGFVVIPPGIDVETFYPFYHNMVADSERPESDIYAEASMLKEMNRFFIHPDKPLILALCRPDKRKNISGLIQAYGEDRQLQAMANLAVFAGIRKDIDAMEENERDVLTRMLLLMDKYDLYGKMAIPKKHDFELEVPVLYRIAAASRGVFVNPAMIEPFGLTLLEASATGLPFVATRDGGPLDIERNCKNGILVDPSQPSAIAAAIRTIIADEDRWERYSKNGVLNLRKHYTWQSHAATYVDRITRLASKVGATDMAEIVPTDAIGRRLLSLRSFLITDIDNTLIGEDNSHLPALVDFIKANRHCLGFGVATGRTIASAKAVLQEHGVPEPDVIVSSVGSEIYYGPRQQFGRGWATHIGHQWNREKIVSILDGLPFLRYQEADTQRPYKISYDMEPKKDRLSTIHNLLLANKCRYNLIYSHDRFLDILPYRASKGKAIRYLSYKWVIPLRQFLVCGDSGNDEELLRGEPMGVVVGNYSHEMEALRGARKVFFSGAACAGGILEGIEYYRFDGKMKAESHDDSK
ncbi:MAG: HAD-IIB family hydrolase [Desulfobacterales bacterium]|nr:HAD-IIB family hydrolase [Desulfobacterales bacterium]